MWVIDLTGSQFGIFKPLWKWADYERNFIDYTIQCEIFVAGVHQKLLQAQSLMPGFPQLAYYLPMRIANDMDDNVKTWSTKSPVRISQLVLAGDDDYAVHQEDLLNVLKTGIVTFKDKFDVPALVKSVASYAAQHTDADMKCQ